MANIVLNEHDLLNTAKKFDNASDKLGGALTKVDGIMSDLNTTWEDDNSKVYQQKYN